MPDALHFLVLTVAGWVNRPQKISSRISEKSNGASGPGGLVEPGACPWLAASARPVALLHEDPAGGALLVTLRRSHTIGMRSKVHPTYKTKYRVANWPAYNQAVRLEFPILSLHPGLRQRCVAPDVGPTLSRRSGAPAVLRRADRDTARLQATSPGRTRAPDQWRCCMKPLAGEVVWPALLLTLCSQWLQPPGGAR